MFCRFGVTLGFPNEQSPQFAATLETRDPVATLHYAAELGFAGADDPFLLRRPTSEQDAIGAGLARLELEFGNAVLAPNTAREPLWGLDDDAARGEIDRRLEAAIDGLKRVGGRNLTVITGRAPGLARSQQLAAMIENLKRVSDRVEAAGAVLCVEPASEARIPGMLLNNLDDCYLVVSAVRSASVRLLFDTLPVQQTHGDLIANLRRTWPLVGALQISDNPRRLEPGSGEINFANFILAALELGHQGLICLEHQNSVAGAQGESLALERLLAIDAMVAQAARQRAAPPSV